MDANSAGAPRPGQIVEAGGVALRLVTPYAPGHPEGPWWAQAEDSGKTQLVVASADGWAVVRLAEAEERSKEARR